MAKPRLTKLLPWAALLVMGALWGLSFSLARIVTAAGGTPFGVTFWQSVVCGVILLGFTLARRRPLTLDSRHLQIYVIVALLGASIPHSLFYFAAPYVQAGVLSITVTLIPIITYAVATAIKASAFSAVRVTGVVCGAVAIIMLVVPESSLRAGRPCPGPAGLSQRGLQRAREHLSLAAVPAGYRPGENRLRHEPVRRGDHAADRAWQRPDVHAEPVIRHPGMDHHRTRADQCRRLHHLHHGDPACRAAFCQPDRICRDACRRDLGYLSVRETHSAWVWGSVVVMMLGLALVTPRRTDADDNVAEASSGPRNRLALLVEGGNAPRRSAVVTVRL